jgi:hypothetical protein
MAESAIEIAQRMELRGPNSSLWIGVVPSDAALEFALDNFRTDVSSLLQKPTREFVLRETSFEVLTESLQDPSDDVVILIAGDLTAAEWSAFDLSRSALERPGPIVLWGSASSIQGLTQYAPNIRSYLGSSLLAVGRDGGIMTDAERLRRLQELRDHYHTTDDEVIHRAESRELDLEPLFIEWLVLLGRGDLV